MSTPSRCASRHRPPNTSRQASCGRPHSATPAKATEAKLLQVPVGTPLLRISFAPHDIQGQPLAYSVMHFRADRFAYRAIIRR